MGRPRDRLGCIVLTGLSGGELVRLCVDQTGEEEWLEFTRRFHGVIAASAARIARLHNRADAGTVEDIVQEVYVKLCENRYCILRQFHEVREDALFAFLKVVSANVARDWFAAAMAEKRGSGKLIPFPAERNDAPAPGNLEDRISDDIILQDIYAILARGGEGTSSGRVSTIFRLHYQQGFTAKEIAAIPAFGLSVKGVESILQRAVRQVRSELAEGYEAKKPF